MFTLRNLVAAHSRLSFSSFFSYPQRFYSFRPFDPLSQSQTQKLLDPAPMVQPIDCIVMSHLETIKPQPWLSTFSSLNWDEHNVNEDISVESTKRKRQRKMNKHKHRKMLKKMKFTLRKVGRK